MTTPHGSGGPAPERADGPGPGGARRPGNPRPLIALGIAVIAVCTVVLFVLGRADPDPASLQAGDCLPAASDAAVSCDDDAAAYRVLEIREDVPEGSAPTTCARVPGVLAYGWQGPAGRPGTALCLGPV